MSPIIISVVVPTIGRIRLLKRCLNALCAQSLSTDEYEIILVDDGNNLETKEIFNYFQDKANGVFIRYAKTLPGHKGPAAARNIGWRMAKGSIIAFTDDDCLPAYEWLESGLVYFNDDRLMGLSGKVVVPIKDVPTDYERCISWMQDAPFVTANSFYRKKALLKAGGFDENFTVAWREDTDLYFTLRELGMRLCCAPDVIVIHPVRRVPWGVSIQEQKKSLFNALLYKKHPALYKKIIEKKPPWNYYLMALFLSLSMSGIVLKIPDLSAFTFLLWMLLSLRFTIYRLKGASHKLSHVMEMIVTSFIIPFNAIFWRIRGAIKYKVIYL